MSDKTIYKSNLTYIGSPRHLLIFLDGTWNDENGRENDVVVTNIYRLFHP